MFGLPPDLDISFFEGLDLTQICVGEHQVIFNFHPDVHLSVESTMRLQTSAGDVTAVVDFRQTAGVLLGLISHPVERATRTDAGDLRLEWSDGAALEVYDSSEHYESYTIRHGDRLVVVV